MKKEVSININTNVNTESLKQAKNEIESFRRECENDSIRLSIDKKSLHIDTKSFYKAIAAAKDLEKEINTVEKTAPKMLKALEEANIGHGYLGNFKEELKDAVAVFDDKSIVNGIDNIVSKIANGFQIIAVDLGGRTQYLKEEIAESIRQLELSKDIGRKNDWVSRNFSSFTSDMDEDALSSHIELLKKLVSYQKELETFSSKPFDFKSAPLGSNTQSAESNIKSLEKFLAKMHEYNSQVEDQYKLSSELFKKRQEILKEANNNFWDEDSQVKAIRDIENDDSAFYNDNIQALEEYIECKKNAIQQLQEQQSTLFRVDDVSEIVNNASNDLKQYEKYLQELRNKHDGIDNVQNVSNTLTEIDLTEVLVALKKIEEAVTNVADAFKPLTDALGNEESAINAMVTSNVAQLDELVNKFKEVHEMINQLNQKDFSITNVYNQKTTQSMLDSTQIDVYKSKVEETLKIVNTLSQAVSKSPSAGKILFANGSATEYTKLFTNMFGDKGVFNNLDFIERIAGADTLAKMKKVAAGLDVYKNAVVEAAKALNALEPESIDLSILNVLDEIDERIKNASKVSIDPVTKTDKGDSKANIQASADEAITQITTLNGQISEELTSIRAQIENTFDFSTINPNLENIQSITDQIYQQFVELQSKIKALDFKIDVPTDGISQITQVITQEGKSAEDAVPKKNAFTEANKKVAASMQDTGEAGNVAVEGIKAEETAAESMAGTIEKSANKIIASQEEIENKYKTAFGGSGKVSKNLASIFNQELAIAGIDVSSINAAFNQKSETVGKGDEKKVITYDTIKLIAQGTDALGKATTVTREYEVATGALIKQMGGFKDVKDTFDIQKETETANSKVAELEKRMGSFKINLEDVKEAAKNITDQTSLDIFEKALEAANQQLKEIKASLKSSHSLDPIVNAESMMSTLPETIAKYRETIKQFANVEGFDKLESSLDVIETKLKEFEANQAFGGNGIDMASIVADINKEITTYNANLGLITERHKANTRAANEAAKAEKQRISEQNAAEKKVAQQSKFELDLNRQTGLLTKQQARWEAMGILTDELKEKINSMFDALAQVTDSNGLSAWKTQWEMVKDQVAETQLQIEAANKAQKEKASERKAARAYWDEEFNYSLNNLITPKKRPELEQLKVSMLRQAEITKESVMEQYQAIMTIIDKKNESLNKLMSAKDAADQNYWQDEYSTWFGAWNALDPNAVSNFFNDVSNQAILGAENIEKFNDALKESKRLAAKQQEKTLKAQEDAQNQAAKLSAKAAKESMQKQNFKLDLERQTVYLTKQQAQWEKNGQLTDDLRLSIELMFESLTEVTNSSELSAWKKQWAIVKDEVAATKHQIDAANKAQKEADLARVAQENAKATERGAAKAYWDSAFKESVSNLVTPKKRPELEQLKAYMLSQAEQTKESVMEQYKAIFTIISNKNIALEKLMAAKGPYDKQYWQDEYSAWFGAWNNLDQNVVSNFFKDAGNQAILGKDKVEEFNNELEKSTQLANKQKDTEFNKKAKEQEKINKKNQNYGKTEYNKYAKFYESMNATIRNIEQNGSINQYLDGLVQKYTEVYKKIEAMRKQFAENPDAANDIELKNQFQDAVVEAEKLRKEITGVFNEAKKFDQVDRFGEVFTLDKYNFDDIKSSLIAFANEVTNGKVKLEGFNDAGTQLYGTLDNGSGSIEQVTFALREGTNQLYAYSAATGKAKNEWEDFKAQAVAGAKNLIGMYVGFQEGVQAFRTGVNYVKEIDLAMTELKKVTDETDASYKQFLKDAASTSSIIGSTISDFTEATANFARLGYSMEESASMAETAIIYKNVADGLDTVEESTESIISTMKAFGIEASDTMGIIDRFNEVGEYLPTIK